MAESDTPDPNSSPPVTEMDIQNFDPQQYLNQTRSALIEQNRNEIESKYGDIGHGVESFRQGIANGLTVGTADLTRTTPEAKLDARMTRQAHPFAYLAGNIAGGLGLTAATEGVAGLPELGVIGQAAKFAIQGATQGAGDVISEAALNDARLGDPSLSAQKIVAKVGLSAILGGTFGALSKGLPAGVSDKLASAYDKIAEHAGSPLEHTMGIMKHIPGLGGVVDKIESGQAAIDGALRSAGRAIANGEAINESVISPLAHTSNTAYDEREENIARMAGDPNAFLNQLSQKAHALNNAAPNTGAALSSTVANAVQFLNSKIPKPAEQMVFSQDFEPSDSQKNQFNTYYDAVSQPLSVLHNVSDGTFSAPQMEALQAVHPDLLKQMQQSVMTYLKKEKAEDMPYANKMAIAKFLGTPLDENMSPAVVIANQAMHNAATMSQQALPKQGRKQQPLGPMKNIKLASRTATETQDQEED